MIAQSSGDLPPNAEPGKCYAVSVVPEIIEETSIEIPVYIGDENDTIVKREKKEFVLSKKTSKWVNKKYPGNCTSPNPDDCMMTCVVEVPAEKIERMVVSDTSNVSSFKMETIVLSETKKKSGIGKSYAVSLSPEVIEERPIEIPVYIGDENDTTVKREKKEFVLSEESTKLVRKKVVKNCPSKNPDDCWVTSLVKVPAEKIERMVVSDTSDFSSYKMETIVLKKIVHKRRNEYWLEVLCEDNVNEAFVSNLHLKLMGKQFLKEMPTSSEFCRVTKSALKAYQKEHGLPVGNLDFATLAHLGIDY